MQLQGAGFLLVQWEFPHKAGEAALKLQAAQADKVAASMQMAMQEAKVVVEMEWKVVAVAALHQVVEEASMGAEALGEELTFQVEEAAVVT